ncbi:MAG: hypothetical protein ACLP7P_07720 [Rhodomicrobium sp.]
MYSKRIMPAAYLSLAIVIATGLFSIGSPSIADGDDHSYLPPWMLDESGAIKADEKVGRPRAPLIVEVQPAKVEVSPVTPDKPNSPDLTAKATQASSRVVGFVSNLFRRSIRFTMGE